MAKKTSLKATSQKTVKTKQHLIKNPLHLPIPSILSQLKEGGKAAKSDVGFVFVLGLDEKKKLQELIQKWAPAWQKNQLKKSTREMIQFVSNKGPVWILCPKKRTGAVSHAGRLEESTYAWTRDQAGSMVGIFKAYQVEHLQVELWATNDEQELGFLVGLEMAAYNYRQIIDGQGLKGFPSLQIKKLGGSLNKSTLKNAKSMGRAVNLARHLVNTPPNFFNPSTGSEFAVNNFKAQKNITVTVWDEKKLSQEGMGLLLGVGQGSNRPPCMVHIKYRPSSDNSGKKPIAFVGKGVTFDSGGLDIKPSSGMRLMKKDMGGTAAVLALAQWASENNYSRALDFYLALAENSVDGNSFRPSDVLTARNGMTVEIHNTDAEGRLVMADVLDVAVTQKGADEPDIVIDVATLTGAIKVALGADIAGLFSNSDELAEDLNQAGQRSGDLNWRMPLFGKYTNGMASPFADIVNATDGFGGAITAALFLEKFVKQKPWAHLDIYAWSDKASGALSASGGNGQAVQALIAFLEAKA